MTDSANKEQESARSLHNPEVRYHWPHTIVKNFALEICQLLFYEGNPIGYTWDPSQEHTQVTIVDKHSFNLDQVGTKPAIVANRGPIRYLKTSGFRQLQDHDWKSGKRTYTDLVRGTAILSCFSRQGLEAENIAGYIFASFQNLRDELRKIGSRGIMAPNHLGFFRIETTNMGEEALVKSDSRIEISVVPVAIQAMVQRRWAVTPDTRKLQGLGVRTSRSGT